MREGKQKVSDTATLSSKSEVGSVLTTTAHSDTKNPTSRDEDTQESSTSTEPPPNDAEEDAHVVKGEKGADDDTPPEEDSKSTEPSSTAAGAKAAAAAAGTDPATQGWQAIWDPTRNAYYFWHEATQSSTWDNPYEKATTSSSSSTANNAPQQQIPDRALGEIDPELAFLDPSLAASSTRKNPSSSSAYTAAAHFDPRTGRFLASTPSTTTISPALADKHGAYSNPTTFFSAPHRAKRQMDVFFDSEAWEEERAARALELDRKRRRIEQGLPPEEGEGEKGGRRGEGEHGSDQALYEGEEGGSARPTKKDIKAFKAKKLEQKKKKLDWLRS
ncbi:hypothetical protein CF319_g2849 [Tilletia indica]|nr:hypothetical protein CF319_g2849 [Tilletia indica]